MTSNKYLWIGPTGAGTTTVPQLPPWVRPLPVVVFDSLGDDDLPVRGDDEPSSSAQPLALQDRIAAEARALKEARDGIRRSDPTGRKR